MESVINKIKQLPASIENAFSEDLSTLAGYLLIDFDIQFRDSDEKVSKELLIKYIRKCLGVKDNICCAVTRVGTRCTSKVNGSKYCKRHVNKEVFEREFAFKSEIVIEIVKNNIQEHLCTNTGQLRKQFIEDTFYYTDEKFIYNIETMEKEGCIVNDNDKQFVLTRDPFILNGFDS
jgi:hypothetical protein